MYTPSWAWPLDLLHMLFFGEAELQPLPPVFRPGVTVRALWGGPDMKIDAVVDGEAHGMARCSWEENGRLKLDLFCTDDLAVVSVCEWPSGAVLAAGEVS
jgi:uncharacterized protein YodC (DUF2158 family)